MNDNILGLLLSYGLIIIFLILSTTLQKFNVLKDEGSRKLIHIGVSNWWIIAMIYFDNMWIASIPPITFIILNYISYKYNLVKAMERERNDDLGTVYYPISLFVLVLFTFSNLTKTYVGAIGILIMGYADGLTAIIGKKYGKTKIYHNKSFQGSLTMFVVTFMITIMILSIYNPSVMVIASFVIAVIATLLELFTPKGLDNLTVPLITSFAYYLLFYL